MTPYYASGESQLFDISYNGTLSSYSATSAGPGSHNIRPVISIVGNASWKSGDGSPSNPYTIVESNN